jgi:hypothetical protein
MLASGQKTIESYLDLLSEHTTVQVAVVIALSWGLAVVVDRL